MMIFETAACFKAFIRAWRIAMSSCRSLPYSFLPANQRESQVRLTPSRRPIGLTFCPILLSSGLGRLADFTQNDRQMREGLLDPARPSARARAEPFHHQRLADMSLGHNEIVDVETVVVFRIG